MCCCCAAAGGAVGVAAAAAAAAVVRLPSARSLLDQPMRNSIGHHKNHYQIIT